MFSLDECSVFSLGECSVFSLERSEYLANEGLGFRV